MWAGVLNAILIVVALILSGSEFTLLGAKWNAGLTLFVFQFLYTLGSLRTIGPDKQGLVLVFGRSVFAARPGLVFVPLFICELELYPLTNIEHEWPGEPEDIFHGDGSPPEGSNKVPPNRITFGDYAEGKDGDPDDPDGFRKGLSKDDPLNRRVTIEHVPIVGIYKIVDPINFRQKFGSLKEADRILNDVALGAVADDFGKFTAAVVNKHLSKFTEKVEGAVRRFIDPSWGIAILRVQIKQLKPSHGLNTQIEEMAKAAAAKIAKVTSAEGVREERRLHGEGEGLGQRARLKGFGDGIREGSALAGVSATSFLGADTAKEITKNPGQKTIVVGAGGLSEIIGVASAVGESLKAKKDDTPPDDKKE